MGSPQEILKKAHEEAKQAEEVKAVQVLQVQEQKRRGPLSMIRDANEFAKTPLGGIAMDILGLADKKKQPVNNSWFGRTLTSMRENWLVFFLVPFALTTAFIMSGLMLVFFYKLMMKIMGMV